MDPNKTLAEIRKLTAITNTRALTNAEAEYLAEHVIALDQWLSSGGFPPDAWNDGRPG